MCINLSNPADPLLIFPKPSWKSNMIKTNTRFSTPNISGPIRIPSPFDLERGSAASDSFDSSDQGIAPTALDWCDAQPEEKEIQPLRTIHESEQYAVGGNTC